ncbi:Mobile element protein [Richelia intracellularis]|nr:Mobile element protein [Richelia intracellularis]
MGGKLMGFIGKQLVKASIGVKNLVYNFKRYTFWENKNPKAVG